MDSTYIKTTEDGRLVEVIDGWVCLAGAHEANNLIPINEHPNRQAILRAVPGASHMAGRLPLTTAQAGLVLTALTAAQRLFDASPNGITQRIRKGVWAKAAIEGVE